MIKSKPGLGPQRQKLLQELWWQDLLPEHCGASRSRTKPGSASHWQTD